MAEGYPTLVVTLRLIVPHAKKATDMWAYFANTRDFYRTIGVELEVHGDQVEVVEDIAGLIDTQAVVARVWQPNRPYINVVCGAGGGSASEGKSDGETVFPSCEWGENVSGASGSCFIGSQPSDWTVMAHELAHMFGLPHVFDTFYTYFSKDPLVAAHGEWYNNFAMAPFRDDTRDVYERNLAASGYSATVDTVSPTHSFGAAWNLMFKNAPTVPHLLPRQVDRIRLTIVSRRGGVQVADDLHLAQDYGVAPIPFIRLPDTSAAIWRSFL